ncbi:MULTISPECIES: zinc-binding alcohol dehydrogenase family protein [Pseudomonas]|uniref:zinc-binding alcohol dehydrogenase family protein n=1 Tax=Pseudomonas TaxID=286 RepID=UPI000D0356A6|nr:MULTISPECIES: zinc-binding alcohol dehydrogenase family protein [Pseudomonas]PRW89835.1 zinc-binding alcohol dehydrogenase family protein [Pseudomonas simiae]CAH0139902.1 Zinc-type alcohol dehydrogenase-like protein SA1988 [Pseudomonas carnis]CAH0149890.1 Zinc-type alcohol dehydrogenase-like protein SA1988 [Pseudomonas carnis]CAH0209620.1 Zinc-type alcohol dehydrogenase-like protein SA1988 [Pseudomonas carnis]CAH0222870.1 Zinc-type alcohol dehydrogenase-like protein SA1988 [Pseudomonas carn
MKAIAFTQHGLPIENPNSLIDMVLPRPKPGERDLLVEVSAISVNPVDTKIRSGSEVTDPKVLGWDAVGVVREVGSEVTLFSPGDEVFYAGSIVRPGCYSEFHVVDERIVGHKPKTLSAAHAAALPLTSITAWELLFDRLGVAEGGGEGESLLIVGAGGGVGSILVQLARKLTKMTVIGTASRAETADWIKELGAHFVVDHSKPLKAQLEELGFAHLSHVASLTHTDVYLPQLADILSPQGRLAAIDDPASLNVMPLKMKAISFHWEMMFVRSLFETPDMIKQHEMLTRVAELVDQGVLRTTFGQNFGTINAANLRRAHALVESQTAIGKIVLVGF